RRALAGAARAAGERRLALPDDALPRGGRPPLRPARDRRPRRDRRRGDARDADGRGGRGRGHARGRSRPGRCRAGPARGYVQPPRISFPILSPIMPLVRFTAVFSKVTELPGYPARSSLDFLAPGNVALAVVVGAGGAGFQMVQDIDSGFFDKLRVAPINRSSIVAGLLTTDAFRYALHALVVALVAVAIGAKLATGVPGLLVIILLGGLYGAAWSGISLNVALRTRSPEVTAATGILVFPLYFGSTAFMPRGLLPSWLRVLN